MNIQSQWSSIAIFLVVKLNNSTLDAVIGRFRGHFTSWEIPETLVSDNGPQFSFNTSRKFSRYSVFTLETISAGNSQTNGTTETAVKIMKRLMRKCKPSEGLTFLHYITVLNHCNTPTEDLNISPTQSPWYILQRLLKSSYLFSNEETQNKEGRKLK